MNIPGSTGDLFFLNKDTGWISYLPSTDFPRISFTSNGGSNWTIQYIDSLNYVAGEIFFANIRKGWAGRGNFKNYATINGGINWGLQDIPISNADQLSFVDSLLGWAGYIYIIKTTNGGGPITYSGIDSNRKYIPVSFELKQNYPNPFNPQTTIEFSLSKEAYVSLIIYDITGKELFKALKKEKYSAGNYYARLEEMWRIASGTYIYELIVSDENDKIIYSNSKKMVLIK